MNKRLLARLCLVGVCTTIAAGCATSSNSRNEELQQRVQERMSLEQTEQPEREEQPRPDWKERSPNEIAPGFTIKISSRDDAEISGSYVIDEKGFLRLPYDVTVSAAGLSQDALESKIRNAYRAYFLRPDMSVNVEKREYYVNVKGLVKKPGAVLVPSDASLDEVVSIAGGLPENSRSGAQYARITQESTSYVVNLNDYFAGNTPSYAVPKWQGGESIALIREAGNESGGTSRSSFVKVLGQVQNPGEFRYEPGTDFYHYLIKAGGPTDRADLTAISLIRAGRGSNESQRFSLEEEGKTPTITAGDTILLNASNPSSLEKSSRVWGGFAGVVSAIGAIILLALAL
jgi:polysaccharide biosynthesis/export protein